MSLVSHFNYTSQGKYQEIIGGATIYFRNYNEAQQLVFVISAGSYYRLNDATIPTIILDYQNYTFTLSYDVNNSSLQSVSGGNGGFELSIFKRGFIFMNSWTEDKTHCPRFEQMILPNFEQ